MLDTSDLSTCNMIESLAGVERELVQQPHDAATSTAAAAADVTLFHGRLQFTDGREILNSSVDSSVSITTKFSTRRAAGNAQPRQGEKNIRFGEWVRVPVDDDTAIRQNPRPGPTGRTDRRAGGAGGAAGRAGRRGRRPESVLMGGADERALPRS